MMQHIAVIRPEIAASSAATGKVNSSPQPQQGFSHHLHQHQQPQRHSTEAETAQGERVAHREELNAPAQKSQSKQDPGADSGDHPVVKNADQRQPGDSTSQRNASQVDETNTHAKGAEHSVTERQTKEHTDKGSDSAVADEINAKNDIDEGEDKQAEQWLALVHKLVVNAGMAGKETESAEEEGNAQQPHDLSDKLKALLEQLGQEAQKGIDASNTELAAEGALDVQKALLEQLGLNPEMVLQQAEATGKLSELKALLERAADGSESAQGKPIIEQVLALLMSEQKGQSDPGAPIAQNHVLGLKTGTAVPVGNPSEQAELLAARLQEYEQQQEKSGQQDKSIVSLLKTRVDEMMSGTNSEAVASVKDSDNGKQQGRSTDGLKQSSALQHLAQLPEPALDKTLHNLAERLPVKDADPVVINSFIDNLKAGIEEFKQQRAQGREPGLDLQALVSRAMAGEQDVQSAQQHNVTQVVKQFGESLTQSPVNLRSDMNSPLTLSSMERATGQDTQVAAETTKAAPNTVLDRAVNIARPEAAGQLADRVRMLVSQGNMSADIRLDPPDLGSMQIRVTMNGEQASVSFVVQSQQARDMLDQAVPRLREMLAERGIELGQSSVEQQQKDNKSGDSQGQGQLAGGGAEDELNEQQSEQNGAQEIRLANGALGGIDYFV